jgi:hypothetical protein
MPSGTNQMLLVLPSLPLAFKSKTRRVTTACRKPLNTGPRFGLRQAMSVRKDAIAMIEDGLKGRSNPALYSCKRLPEIPSRDYNDLP